DGDRGANVERVGIARRQGVVTTRGIGCRVGAATTVNLGPGLAEVGALPGVRLGERRDRGIDDFRVVRIEGDFRYVAEKRWLRAVLQGRRAGRRGRVGQAAEVASVRTGDQEIRVARGDRVVAEALDVAGSGGNACARLGP